MTLIGLLVGILILGLIAYLVSIAPFIEATFKSIINFVLIVVAVILVIYFLLGVTGTATPSFIR